MCSIMNLLRLPLGAAFMALACSSPNEPVGAAGNSAGGGAGSTSAAGASSAGGGVTGGGSATGGQSANAGGGAGTTAGSAGSAGSNPTAGSSGAGSGGSAGGGVAGDAGASTGGSSVGGAGGAGGASGAAGGSSYEPVQGAKWDEVPLFTGNPPNFKANAPAETVNGQGSISNVSVPTLRRYPMDATKATGFAYLVFPGGAYTGLDFDTHATELAKRVGSQGIAVFGVKYRVGGGTSDAPRDALLDAKRAVRLVRANAARWGVQSGHLGVVGYSAGSHLVLNLAGNFDAGDANASDPVERFSSRPAFVGSMSTWAFYKPESPFTFPSDVPPTFFCHAENDTTAPIALARTVEGQIRAKGAATKLDIYATGGHSACHPGDMSMPGRDWPNKFWPWLQTLMLAP
jgi:acetyl esterase/lipase